MNTAAAHPYQHALHRSLSQLALVALVMAIVLIAMLVGAVSLGTGPDAQPLLAPFRWQPLNPGIA